MGITGRTFAVFTLVSIMPAAQSNGQTEAKPEVMISLHNVAHVSAATVDEAMAVVVGIFRIAGIRVLWRDARADVAVIIARPPYPHSIRDATFALGYALRTNLKPSRVAFALADRIGDTARGLGLRDDVVLGIAMAHEVGHLLLPDNSHAASGIMRREWSQSDYQKARLGQLMFTDAEARLMRAEVARWGPTRPPDGDPVQ
jgi:hypothetical protein